MNPSDTDALMRQWDQQIQAKLKQADQMKQAASEVKVTQRSQDGSVTVTVDQSGNVSALDFTPEALRKQPAQLSAEVLATMRAAQMQLAAKMREAMAPIIGDDSASMDAIMGGYQEKFPEPPEDPTGGPAPRPSGPSDDDDFHGHNFARDDKGW